MKIMIAPLIKELMELYLIDDYLTSIFYFDHDQGVGLFTSTIIRFEYNDTLKNEASDEELEVCLLDYIAEFSDSDHDMDLIIISYPYVIEKIATLVNREFPAIDIIEVSFPENTHQRNQDTVIYRTTSVDDEYAAVDIDYFFPFVADLISRTPIEGSLDSLRENKANLN